ncbi:universal stress protein [uncultured Roseovarius sp.]|uniref:universal stress protein n=1 Tax=uncultured Roseovarius sp. TaxID=293344 RepID=UPI00261FCC5C|nr:universal stress protein [uncultured Roseovarius sp.]
MDQSSLHTIMMPLRDDGLGSVLFAHAAALAKRFNAHVRVVHCHPKAEDMMPFGVVIPGFLRKQLEEASRRSADSEQSFLQEKFIADADRHGISVEPRKAGQPTAAFREYEGKQVDAVRHYGRLADLICVAKPSKEEDLGYNTLKSALFSSGRPVLVCPKTEQVQPDIGRHVAIAWNGSLEASRAVALAMPLIEAAERVTILTGGHIDHTATPEEFKVYLGQRGINAEITTFERQGNVGRTLLEKCKEHGADMLIMGAYHESYERESLLGGNSATIIAEATIPVVMVH